MSTDLTGCFGLPAEIIDDIIRNLGINDLQTVCRASSILNTHATRYLYRNITLEFSLDAVKCFNTILKRRVAALSVRYITLVLKPTYLLYGFYALAASAIQCAELLTKLDIATLPDLLPFLHSVPLPSLTQCNLPDTPLLAPFLARHSLLKTLAVRPPCLFSLYNFASPVEPLPDTEAFPPPLALPRLSTFFGPIPIACRVLPGSATVRHATLVWFSNDEGYGIIPHLTGCKSLQALDIIASWWKPALIPLIASHLPHIQDLAFHCSAIMVVPRRRTYEFLDSIDASLQAFTSLRTISISKVFEMPQCDTSTLDEEFARICRWGTLRSSLQCCSLMSGTQWLRGQQYDIWFPDMGGTPSDTLIKAEWLARAALSGKFPPEVLDLLVDADGEKIYPQLVRLLAQREALNGDEDGNEEEEEEDEEERMDEEQ